MISLFITIGFRLLSVLHAKPISLLTHLTLPQTKPSFQALWNRNCESICHSVALSPTGNYERIGRGAKFCAKSDDGSIKLLYFQFSGASINFFLIFAAFLFELVSCISSIVFNIKSMKDNKIKAKVKPEEKKEDSKEEKTDEKSSEDKKDSKEEGESKKEGDEAPKEEQEQF